MPIISPGPQSFIYAQDGVVGAPLISFAADTDTGIYRIGTNNIGIATAGTQRVNIDAIGNVGLMGVTPLAPLHIADSDGTADSANYPGMVIHNTSTATNSYARLYMQANAVVLNTLLYGYGSALKAEFGTGSNHPLHFKSNSIIRVTIHADGAVTFYNTLQADTSVVIGVAGSTTGVLSFDGATSGTFTQTVAAAAGTWSFTWPAAVPGASGYQLTATDAGIGSWAAASSVRDWKDVGELGNPQDALNKVLGVNVYSFKYLKGQPSTGDLDTEYMGVMADEAPWAMHHEGKIVNPVNTFGYSVLAIQALHDRIESLEKQMGGTHGSN